MSPTNSKPTLVIIHGGWHVPESYEKLITALEDAGYEVHCPRLPSTNQVTQISRCSFLSLDRNQINPGWTCDRPDRRMLISTATRR